MSDKYMRCTSINHCGTSNFQINQAGSKHDCTERFEDWAMKNGALWAHLFEEKSGRMIATYSKDGGLCTLA